MTLSNSPGAPCRIELFTSDPDRAVEFYGQVYLESADIDATGAKALAAGGQDLAGPMQVWPLGHMAVVTDPAGAVVGAWQPLEFGGFAAPAEPGAPAWFETLSNEYEKSLAFYRDAFDWDLKTMSDTPEFR